ncbi:contact-dependent growth inhibition system immunity protein [Streptomyces odontomachi]|uniref:contact-dependent growth inhibition system immunity protein n=1 Tax=Streptomyces odontomachi TaxID=2944940 RepID=UPI00210B0748|nr:contact-dependent growth inhibition system immunity protein [Streptomyces sp. ODS25]
MPLKPLEHDRKYGELDQVLRAYLGQRADDTDEQRSAALTAYLRHTWHSRPWALAVAERQLRDLADNPPGRLRLRLGEYYAVPDVGLTGTELQEWFVRLADHIKQSVTDGDVPPPATPATHWEWQARFPELAQLLGGWFSQDMSDEFDDHEAALADYLATSAATLVARAVGEAHELLALGLDESRLGLATAELGMEVDPPADHGPEGWLVLLAQTLAAGPADAVDPADGPAEPQG